MSGSSDEKRLNARVRKQIKPASELDSHFTALLYGRSGSTKTRTASTAPKPLLIDIDEKGTDSVRNDHNPHVYRVTFWDQVNEVFWYLQSGDHDYETAIVDGLTGLQDLCLAFVLGDEASRDASRDPDMPSRQVYGKVGKLMKTQITNYRNLPMNIIFTALDRKRFTGEDDDDSDEELSIGPALTPSVAGAAERSVALIGYLHKRAVVKRRKEGKKIKTTRVVRTRLIIDDPTEKYMTKDRYHLGGPYIDSPDITNIIQQIYGEGGQ